jgi:hypothetical protein
MNYPCKFGLKKWAAFLVSAVNNFPYLTVVKSARQLKNFDHLNVVTSTNQAPAAMEIKFPALKLVASLSLPPLQSLKVIKIGSICVIRAYRRGLYVWPSGNRAVYNCSEDARGVRSKKLLADRAKSLLKGRRKTHIGSRGATHTYN